MTKNTKNSATMARVSLLAMTILSALFGGCVGEPPIEPQGLALGTGSWRFEALSDGDEVELVRGAQGGWHIWTSVRWENAVGEPPEMTLRAGMADGSGEPHEVPMAGSFDPEHNGHRDLVGFPCILPEPSCMVGELVRIEVDAIVDGQPVHLERDVRVLGGNYPPPACETE